MKKQTSKAYITSQIYLRDALFLEWKTFLEIIEAGPAKTREALKALWESVTEDTISDNFELIDKDKKVSLKDFNVETEKVKGYRAFYFTFPTLDFANSQAKCVAFILTPDMPKYLTMEISEITEETVKYIVGEWKIKDGKFEHHSYKKMTMEDEEDFKENVKNILAAYKKKE